MQTIYSAFLGLHIAGGFLALAIGLVAMFTAKGSKAHKMSGKIYVWGMTAACGSAFYMAIAKPNPFLLMIGVFSYQLVAMGYRAVYLKKLHVKPIAPNWLDWTIGLVPMLVNTIMTIWGIRTIMTGNIFGVTGLVFGAIGVTLAVSWLRQFFKRPVEKNHWVLRHFQNMGGAYIATSTAFLVVNVHFLPPLIIWLAPTIIGTAIMYVITSKYKTARIAVRQPSTIGKIDDGVMRSQATTQR